MLTSMHCNEQVLFAKKGMNGWSECAVNVSCSSSSFRRKTNLLLDNVEEGCRVSEPRS